MALPSEPHRRRRSNNPISSFLETTASNFASLFNPQIPSSPLTLTKSQPHPPSSISLPLFFAPPLSTPTVDSSSAAAAEHSRPAAKSVRVTRLSTNGKGGGPAFVGQVFSMCDLSGTGLMAVSTHFDIPFISKRTPEWLKKVFAAITKSERNGPVFRFFIDLGDAVSYVKKLNIPSGVVGACRLDLAYEHFKEKPHLFQFVPNEKQVKEANKILKTNPHNGVRRKVDGVPVFSAQNLDIAIATTDGVKWYTPYFFDKKMLDNILEEAVDQHFHTLIQTRNMHRRRDVVDDNLAAEVIEEMGDSLGDPPEVQELLDEMGHPSIPLSVISKAAELQFHYTVDKVLLGNRWLRKATRIQPKFPYMVDSFERRSEASFLRLTESSSCLNNPKVHSQMPPEFGLLQNLTVLDLSNSALYGPVPPDLCDSGNLAVLQLDGNSLKGSIPEEIGNCTSLYLLSLSHNKLTGSIPKSMSKLNKLKILKLEFNELSGEIPMELGMLQNLLAVNISYNRLTGRLPTSSIFQNLDKSSLEGNLGICSPLLKGPCKMNAPKPLVIDPNAYNNQIGPPRQRNDSSVSSTPTHHHRFFSVSAIVAICASFLILLGVIAISLLNVSVRRRLSFVDNALESMCSSSSRSGAPPTTGKLVLFDSHHSSPDWITNPESLLNKASEIGEGVFGTVYKVPLGSSTSQGRVVVAIKKLITSNILQYPEDFDREVRILGKAKHPNLVALKGYYWTPQLQFLVSEFAPNGNLQSKLHERLPSSPPLSWPIRFKILLGTAKGLAHLHHSFKPPIIHYNIKPSNILLDENFNPKISDFGLARLLTKLDRHVMSNRFQSALGYVAPELACQSLRVNEKCDVYGFGVMILELVTGRRPVEYGEDNVLILNDHVRVLLEHGNVLECVDPSMSHEYPDDEVLPVLKLAMVCTSQIPSSRPTMAEVVQILQVIKTPVPQRMDETCFSV